jgi:hypothetical protein
MLTAHATLRGVTETDEELRERIATEHLGDPKLGDHLRGDDEVALREDAEEFRDQANFTGTGRPSLAAAVFAMHERERRLTERVLGWSERGAP